MVVSLNSRLESNKEEEEEVGIVKFSSSFQVQSTLELFQALFISGQPQHVDLRIVSQSTRVRQS